jgi:PIN domain nuclease of toxin-antitoxin system
MSDTVVLDASAVLALIHDEPGAEEVEATLGDAVMSTVNWAEVAGLLDARGLPVAPLRETIMALGIELRAFAPDDADQTGALYATTRPLGLSLADRACLALARKLGAPALTADRAWLDVDVDVDVGVDVRCVR